MPKKKKEKINNKPKYKNLMLPPIALEPGIEDLCNKIDVFYLNYPKQHKRQKASDLIRGAFYAMRPECRSNSDWMSQSANSFRDILYPLLSEQMSSNNLVKLFRKYATNEGNKDKIKDEEFVSTFNNLDTIYKQISDFTHHGTDLKGFSEERFLNFSDDDFEYLMNDFVRILRKSLSFQQIYVHKIIDLITQKKKWTKGLKYDLSLILQTNYDAKAYFFTKVSDKRVSWLWERDFLDAIREKSEDPTRYGGQRFPELSYLVRVSEKYPRQVAKIILKIKVSKDHFNPEVLDRFLWICGSNLRAEDLKLIIPKIEKEKWVSLMGAFNSFGFEYENMFKTLKETEDYYSVINLAKAVLSVRNMNVVKNEGFTGISTENPFYFNNLSHTKVFEHFAGVDSEHAEQALITAIKVMKEIILLGGKAEQREVFSIKETFHLYDVDFFSLELGGKEGFSYRDDVRQLASVIKILANKTIGAHDTDPFRAKKIYENCFESLPDSRSMWRLRLYVMSIYPEYFKKELRKSFFKLFRVIEDGKSYNDIISGAEYERALHKSFTTLSKSDQRDYIAKVIKYFRKKYEEGKKDKEDWHLRYGSRILTVIKDHLNTDEQKELKKNGFKIIPKYKPEPSIKMDGFAHTVVPQAPFTYEKFQKMDIPKINERLRDEWSPENLFKKYKSDDYLRPRNAEGVGQFLERSIKERLQEFVNNSDKFFERDLLDQHYTYSFLRGIQEAIKENRKLAKKVDWDNLITLCKTIKRSGKENAFENKRNGRDKFDSWLFGWTAVHSAITDVLQALLNGEPVINFSKYRNDLLSIIDYLLSHSDPNPKDEKIETAGMKTSLPGSNEYVVSDPFTIAINAVRGRAFQTFVMFIEKDGKRLSSDVKKIYENVLEKENTRAIMFMFGHYLPTFFFRNKKWIKDNILPKVFSEEPKKKKLYLASWEGYLADNLYGDMFFDVKMQKLYKKGIVSTNIEYLQQKHFKNPDEGLAVHLALAFMHYKDFNFEHPLFKLFWTKGNSKQHAEFVSFIGRSFISGSNSNANELLKKNLMARENLKKLWDYLLVNYNDPKIFVKMGFWISLEKDIFEAKWLAEHTKNTLKKTKGVLDWEFGLINSIIKLAKEAPKETLEIVRLYLLEGGIHGENRQIPLHVDNECYKAFEVLHNTPDEEIKKGVRVLIDELITEGSGSFWGLKDVLKKEK